MKPAEFVVPYFFRLPCLKAPALDALGHGHFKADNGIPSKNIMCKTCQQPQPCQLPIIDMPRLDPNVMLEQGLGKPAIIIKDKNTEAISDLGSMEYIKHSHAGDSQQKLLEVLSKKIPTGQQ